MLEPCFPTQTPVIWLMHPCGCACVRGVLLGWGRRGQLGVVWAWLVLRAPILLHHAFQVKKQGNSCLARAEQHLGFWLGTSSQTLFSFWNSVKQMLWKFPRKKMKINPGYVFILLSWNSQQVFFRLLYPNCRVSRHHSHWSICSVPWGLEFHENCLISCRLALTHASSPLPRQCMKCVLLYWAQLQCP